MNTRFHGFVRCFLAFFAAVACMPGSGTLAAEPDQRAGSRQYVKARSPIDAGRYIVTIGGCNDCHTPNWAESDGNVPEQAWLTGSPIGWRGPWGTTYASNLRIVAAQTTEDAWVQMLRHRNARPPMPWMNVAKMSDKDARAVYRFVTSLGVAGERMPAYVEPGLEPPTAYFLLEPVGPKGAAAVAAQTGTTTE